MEERNPLLEDDIATVLKRQSIPMAIGSLCMISVNLIDTYWASTLGTLELAALSFTFPVIGIMFNISIGLMIGTSVAIARILGTGDLRKAKTISTHALYLGCLIVLLVSVLGIASLDWLFRCLGAGEDVLVHIKSYMTIWYASSVFLIVPMMINGVLRAKGDAQTPMRMMMLSAILNAIFDPFFIFTLDMKLEGAAWATTLSRALTMFYAGYVMIVKAKLFDAHIPQIAVLVDSWKTILRVGIPASITNVLGPIATAMLTTIVAMYGTAAIAAYGIGARVESLMLIAPTALSSGLSPFIGQNWGAHLENRVSEGFRIALHFSIAWGLGSFFLLILCAPYLARIFSEDPSVQEYVTLYLRVVPIGFASYCAMLMVNSSFNALDHAFRSSILSVLRSIIFAVPIAWIGSQYLGLEGVFLGLAIGSFLSILIGLHWMQALLNESQFDHTEKSIQTNMEIEFLISHTQPELQNRMHTLIRKVCALEEVELHQIRSDAVGFFVGKRQLGHIHPSGHIDLPLPMELGTLLCSSQKVVPHRLHENNGWFSHELHNADDIEISFWLLSLAHAVYMMRVHGWSDTQTQREIEHLSLTQKEKDMMLLSLERCTLQNKQG